MEQCEQPKKGTQVTIGAGSKLDSQDIAILRKLFAEVIIEKEANQETQEK